MPSTASSPLRKRFGGPGKVFHHAAGPGPCDLRLHDNPDLKGDGGKPKDGEQELRVLEKFIDFDCHGDSGEDQHHNSGRNDEPDRKGSAP